MAKEPRVGGNGPVWMSLDEFGIGVINDMLLVVKFAAAKDFVET